VARRKFRKSLVISILVHALVIAALAIYLIKIDAGGRAGAPGAGMPGNGSNAARSGTAGEYSQTDVILVTATRDRDPSPDIRKPVANKETKPNMPTPEIKKKEKKETKKPSKNSSAIKEVNNASQPDNAQARGESESVNDAQGAGMSKGIDLGGTGAAEVALLQPRSGVSEKARPDYNINPKPKYPNMALRRGYEGKVLIRVFVLESGAVGDIEVTKPSGHSVLDESAVKAVRDWVFIPGKENGKEISSWVTVPIQFQLDKG